MMNYTLRKGLNVPVISVVDESGQILADDQRRVFRHIIQNGFGADVIFANGTTGEWNRLANSDRQRLMALAVDEIRQINTELAIQRRLPVEVWVGVNGTTRREVLDNLDAAIQLGADAAVIAPLAVNDLAERDIAHFFLREMNDLIELSPQPLPVFLYDNADINAPGRSDHLRTRIVKELSRLPWVRGIKVSASRQALGNYTKAALHFKQPGEFGIYIGNAMLIFDWFRPTHGLVGRLRAGWNEWLLNRALPVGVVSGPGNVLPREWQKAWRVCWAGDEELMNSYARMFTDFENLCAFAQPGHSQSVGKMIACLKSALEYNGVISSSAVAPGTNALTEREKELFIEGWIRLRAEISQPGSQWTTSIETARAETKRP
jgi:dihydrodipicolinate synthase/N-acetylneuraminate lyase